MLAAAWKMANREPKLVTMSLRVGRYETIRPIASGGMARVYLGRVRGIGGFERLVAVKIMHQHLAEEAQFVSMFLDEARLAAGIRHPNVVATIDVGKSDHGLFLVMEYVEGPSLRKLAQACLDVGRRIPLPIVVRVMVDTLSGLHAAHETTDKRGEPLELVHRDISPANVLVGADGICRITDFGVARARSRLSSTEGGKIKGKISYMAPEQLLAEKVDRRTDAYAAAVVLWETLTGQRLFVAENDGALLSKLIAGATRSPREVVEEVSAGIDAVCMRALSIEPTDRFASAATFADALESAANDDGVGIANSRAVAAFVEEIGAHEPLRLEQLEDAADSDASPAAPVSKATTSTDAPAIAGTADTAITEVTASTDARPEPTRSRWPIFVGAAVAALSGAVVAVAFIGGGVNGAQPPAETSSKAASTQLQATSTRPTEGSTGSETASGAATTATIATSSAPKTTAAATTSTSTRPRTPTASRPKATGPVNTTKPNPHPASTLVHPEAL